jgi:hypothetical protein
MTKRCKKCGATKALEDFYKAAGTRDGLRGECKECNAAAKAAWYQRNRAAVIRKVQAWQAANPERVKAVRKKRNVARRAEHREAHLVRTFGITQSEYDAMLAAQGGACAICDRSPREGSSLHVDHDHGTGRIRGLLCFRCNGGLGQFAEDVDRLVAATGYVVRGDDLHPLTLERALTLRAA